MTSHIYSFSEPAACSLAHGDELSAVSLFHEYFRNLIVPSLLQPLTAYLTFLLSVEVLFLLSKVSPFFPVFFLESLLP